MSNQNKQKRPIYTIEFKQDAAKLISPRCNSCSDRLLLILPIFHRHLNDK